MKSAFYIFKKWLATATNIDPQPTDDQPTEYTPTDLQPTDNWPTDCWQSIYPIWHDPMKILKNFKFFSNSWVSFVIEKNFWPFCIIALSIFMCLMRY